MRTEKENYPPELSTLAQRIRYIFYFTRTWQLIPTPILSKTGASLQPVLLRRKLETNKIRVSTCDDHDRVVTVEGVHEQIFRRLFRGSRNNELDLDTLPAVVQYFGHDATAKFYESGDISLIVPWSKLNRNIDNGEFVEGKLVVPLCFVVLRAVWWP